VVKNYVSPVIPVNVHIVQCLVLHDRQRLPLDDNRAVPDEKVQHL